MKLHPNPQRPPRTPNQQTGLLVRGPKRQHSSHSGAAERVLEGNCQKEDRKDSMNAPDHFLVDGKQMPLGKVPELLRSVQHFGYQEGIVKGHSDVLTISLDLLDVQHWAPFCLRISRGHRPRCAR